MQAPTVEYDLLQNLIIVTVVVSPVDAQDIRIDAPPVTLLFGTWALTWNLVTTAGLSAEFGEPGIILPPEMNQSPVSVLSNPSRDDGQWAAILQNHGSAMAVFNYSISVDWSFVDPAQAPSPQIPQKHVKTIKDPTIAVVEEPVG